MRFLSCLPLPLKLEIGAVDLIERKGNLPTVGEGDSHGLPTGFVVDGAGYDAVEVLQIFGNGLFQNDLGLLALKALPVLPAAELALHAGGADFKFIRIVDGVFGVEQRAHLAGNGFAIGVSNAFGFVDGDAKQPGAARTFEFQFEEFDTGGPDDTFGELLKVCLEFVASHIVNPSARPIKKWAFAHSIGSSLKSQYNRIPAWTEQDRGCPWIKGVEPFCPMRWGETAGG